MKAAQEPQKEGSNLVRKAQFEQALCEMNGKLRLPKSEYIFMLSTLLLKIRSVAIAALLLQNITAAFEIRKLKLQK